MTEKDGFGSPPLLPQMVRAVKATEVVLPLPVRLRGSEGLLALRGTEL